MIYILMRKKTVTAKELAEHFGVSTRTVYRDVDVLSLSGIPVYTEKGKRGGISMMPGFVLDKSLLNEREQHEILSALQGLAGVRAAETDRVLTKLSALFNKNMANWLDVDFTNWSFGGGEVFSDLKTAILEKRVVSYDYYSSYGEKTERIAEPVQLWFKHRSWYLKAFCLSKTEVRIFKLTRIKNLKLTDKNFSDRNYSDRNFIAQNSTGETAPDDDENKSVIKPQKTETLYVSVVLKIAPCMAYRVFDEFGPENFKRDADGNFIVSDTWPEDDWVYGTILSYGENIEVLEPERLRKIIRDKAKKIAARYSNMT